MRPISEYQNAVRLGGTRILRWILLGGLCVPGLTMLATPPGEVVSARLRDLVEPVFPVNADAVGIHDGVVSAVVHIGSDGTVKDYLLLYASHRYFLPPVEKVISRWKFEPAMVDGSATDTVKSIDIVFQGGLLSVVNSTMSIHSRYVGDFDRQHAEQLVVKPSDLDRLPKPLKIVEPYIFAEIPADKRVGTMVFQFFIDQEGRVRLPALIEREGDPRLANGALEALKQWRFEPPTTEGRPTVVQIRQKFNFAPN